MSRLSSAARPFQEVGEEARPKALALLRMELSADDVVARHDRGHPAAVVGSGDEIGVVGHLQKA